MTRDRISALIAIAIGAFFLPFSLKIQKATVFANKNDPGSRFFPVLACGIIIISGICLFITAPKDQKRYFTNKQWKDLAVGFGVTVLYVFVMNFTGFFSATAVFLFVMCTLFSRKRKIALWKRLLYGVVVSGAIYCLFTYVLNMRLQTGFLI